MKKWFKITLYVLGSLAVLGWIWRVGQADDLDKNLVRQSQQKAVEDLAARPNAKRDLVINSFRWQKNDVGTVAYHWFTVFNTSKRHTYTKLPIRFIYYSEIGNEVGCINKVIDRTIRTGESIRMENVETEIRYQYADGADMEITE
ncbi:hypothetical protein [Spirosoma oryzicola]|uniref:hypothetical protein n=1 Tax=Spirosoma oryzicola TaxID=2898794 RepID=UPI001E30282F|nr:hypothetical protein [Spirosoma oryzicola]UHG94511.1 hypothetical protein LQ777_28395 [Spirosoma oryzicola]